MKEIITLFLCISLFLTGQAQVSKTINVTTAGTLTTFLTKTEKTTITKLTVLGNIDARDFKCMRDSMNSLAVLDISTVNISSYLGSLGTNPAKSSPYPANEIPEYSFYKGTSDKISLNTILLPNSITSIGDHAFDWCNRLSCALIFPTSLANIGNYAFENCSGLSGNLVIPASVNTVGDYAFAGCSGFTGALNILGSISTIGKYTFNTCINFTSLSLPTSVNTINDYAFANCTGLTGNLNIPNSVTTINEGAFYYCNRINGNLILPNSLLNIGVEAFMSCHGLTSLTLPGLLVSIGNNAFASCDYLQSIYVNSKVPISFVSSSSSIVFEAVNTFTCKLYVPNGTKSAYQSANEWKNFTNIIEMTSDDPTILDARVSLFPNPVTTSFQINGIEGIYTVTLSNLNGKTLLTKQITGSENISVFNLTIGMYIAKIITKEGTFERKIVKE